MRICFVVTEIFHWGKYGGFGSLTRSIGSELVKRGIEVFVVVNKGKGQRSVEILDGMVILGYPLEEKRLRIPAIKHLSMKKVYRLCDADVYHSEEPSLGTYMAMNAMPHRKHIVTSQDPVDEKDLEILYPFYPVLHTVVRGKIYFRIKRRLIREAVREADAVYCQAKYIIPKVKSMYELSKEPGFLPNPVKIPEGKIKKAEEPTVCFLARWDPIKRPEIFFSLAKEFPNVKFTALGKAHDEKRDQNLRKKYSNISNLEMTGFTSEEEKSKILEKSWILINTSVRECLPVAFLETAAHKCAILSSNNPDDFAKNFGYHVTDDNYAKGLRYLLENDIWREKGEKGYHYVKEVHELNKVINQHIKVHKELCRG